MSEQCSGTCRHYGVVERNSADEPVRGCCSPSSAWNGMSRGEWEGIYCPDYEPKDSPHADE